jgi:hypothetical protein
MVFRSKLVLSLILLLRANSFALGADSDPKLEIWSGSLGHVSVVSMSGTVNTQINILGSSLGTGILLGVPNPSLGYHWRDGIEFIVTPNLNWVIPKRTYDDQPTYGSTLISHLTAGIAYHFSGNIRDSFYVRTDFGIAFSKVGELSDENFQFDFSVGKKVRLTESISWSPTFLFEMITTTPHTSLALALIPVQFSLLF